MGVVRAAWWTIPGKGYLSSIGLYGPTETSFDKSRKSSDFEKLK